MCYHVSTPTKEQLEGLAEDEGFELEGEAPRYFHVSGFERPLLSVTLNDQPKYIQDARWKFIPKWVKTEEEAAKYANTLNAMSEDVFDKPTYKQYIGQYRGLLWVNGFFEPKNVIVNEEGVMIIEKGPAKKIKGVTQKRDNYFIYRPNHEIFTLGIVWSPWQDKNTGKVTNTFAILTTPGNEQTSTIHDRMPLIITKENREAWMNATTREEIEALMKPAPDGYLQAHKIAAHVTSGGQDFNFPEVQAKDISSNTNIEPEQGNLF